MNHSVTLKSNELTITSEFKLFQKPGDEFFFQVGECIPIKLRKPDGTKLLAIIFSFKNNSMDYPCFETKDAPDTLTFRSTIEVSKDFALGKEIRIIYFNEKAFDDVISHIPYFRSRLLKFEYLLNIADEDYKKFDDAWNQSNAGDDDLLVNDICDPLSPIPRQTHDGGVVRIEELP
ncbi:hypothetical protein [Chryseobacterium sp. SIMBA_038]|uniref:hypothetical protein n=1 Tax=Chryseobacterium sp. SIMBA_038 TaxID=3085780 RepID=UPI00397E5FE6